jgi:hypothetical protein
LVKHFNKRQNRKSPLHRIKESDGEAFFFVSTMTNPKKGVKWAYDKDKNIFIMKYKSLVKVTGNLNKYNEQKTFKKYLKSQWRQLVKILATDEKAAEILNSLSTEISMILIRNVREVEHTNEVHDLVNDQLFASFENKTIYSKDISYEINHQAQIFGDLFNINLNKYTMFVVSARLW